MEYGMCRECGKPIELFAYAIEDWLCEYCYLAKFPNPGGAEIPFAPEPPKPGRMQDDSYWFIRKHLYNKPHLYEPGFQKIRPYVLFFRNFEGLEHLLSFLSKPAQGKPTSSPVTRSSSEASYCEVIPQGANPCAATHRVPAGVLASTRRQLKADLISLGRARADLRPQVIEMLLFILWRTLAKEYGKGQGFREAYYNLVLEFDTTN